MSDSPEQKLSDIEKTHSRIVPAETPVWAQVLQVAFMSLSQRMALHVEPYCSEDHQVWPCNTIRIIQGDNASSQS